MVVLSLQQEEVLFELLVVGFFLLALVDVVDVVCVEVYDVARLALDIVVEELLPLQLRL